MQICEKHFMMDDIFWVCLISSKLLKSLTNRICKYYKFNNYGRLIEAVVLSFKYKQSSGRATPFSKEIYQSFYISLYRYLGDSCINELTWRRVAEPCKRIFATVKPTIYGGNASNTIRLFPL